MKCFVASAFDHKDVDAIYDRAVRPVLKELRIRPFRVDRIEHNEDIDDRIFDLIDQSQFCIADLTYARPSVYYEAGYASGKGKPVIYIARSDHFRAREDDEAGNLRVHFDLQMKNIISWTEPNEAFKKRLRRRLRYVLRPLFRDQRKAEIKRANERHFSSLSVNEQLVAILRKGKALLYARGYKKSDLPQHMAWRDPLFHKKVGDTYFQVHLLASPAINKSVLNRVASYWWWVAPKQRKQCSRIEEICIVVSTGTARSTTLATPLASWRPVRDKVFARDDRGFYDNIFSLRTIAFIDDVKSIEEFADRFRSLIDEYGKTKSMQSG